MAATIERGTISSVIVKLRTDVGTPLAIGPADQLSWSLLTFDGKPIAGSHHAILGFFSDSDTMPKTTATTPDTVAVVGAQGGFVANHMVSDTNGQFVFDLTQATPHTWYICFILPSGDIVVGPPLVF